MKPTTFMVIAGEASGDLLAAELVRALRQEFLTAPAVDSAAAQPLESRLAPRFFGAGGPRMAAAGVEVVVDMTAHSVVGLVEVIKHYPKFRRLFRQFYRLALDRQPDVLICVDFSGFNRRFARAIRRQVQTRSGWFHAWRPRMVQYVSPQVWASRESRVYSIAREYDLLLSIFPFEPAWYAQRVPQFPVEFVGHPIRDRYPEWPAAASIERPVGTPPTVLLLPGSRRGELARHLPVMLPALARMRTSFAELRALMVLPNERLLRQAKTFGLPPGLEVRTSGLTDALATSDVAIASTGTVTLECAYFGLPTVALYKTSWATWEIAKRIVKVRYGAMPNILADEEIFPEFIQDAATPKQVADAATALLWDDVRRRKVKGQLASVIASLGGVGASQRAAQAVMRLLAKS